MGARLYHHAIKPKYHHVFHVIDHLRQTGRLLSCFVTERKHRTINPMSVPFGTAASNIAGATIAISAAVAANGGFDVGGMSLRIRDMAEVFDGQWCKPLMEMRVNPVVVSLVHA